MRFLQWRINRRERRLEPLKMGKGLRETKTKSSSSLIQRKRKDSVVLRLRPGWLC
jgi:hypothetical protein